MIRSRNCYFCKYYKDEYCENLELKPCYPQKGCEDFSKRNELKENAEEIHKLILELLKQKPTTKIEESNFSQEQYLADIQSAYDCGKSVIDKIRAEIDVARFIDKDTKLCKNSNASGLEVAMQIIDKYKSESEKENEIQR